ncbi:MAG: NAD(+) diphosphatase [Clostridium sp.]|nr:NAD(+) diphosphatase [Clostridium sp.]
MSDFTILPQMSKKSEENDLCFAFFNNSLLVKKIDNILSIPKFSDIKSLNIKYENEFFIGKLGKSFCFTTKIHNEVDSITNFELLNLRDVASLMEKEIFLMSGRANEILNWDKNSKYCGRCGSKTENKKDEMAKICPNCNNIMYPVICPAIIVGIIKGDKILLAHNSGFKNNKYSLIAGFVEAGETLENAVKREVREEINIKVKNVRYYSSSAWPFPNSLMIGFFADYDSGEIKVDGDEILDAGWFTKDNFPDNIPKKFTVARSIIDEFVKR